MKNYYVLAVVVMLVGSTVQVLGHTKAGRANLGGTAVRRHDGFGRSYTIYRESTEEPGLLATFDVGVDGIDQPADSVSCGDSVHVAATVCNYGDTIQTFDVEAIVDSSGLGIYADTQTVIDLPGDSCISVGFVDWPVPAVHGKSYSVTVTTLLAMDVDSTNNASSKNVVGWCPPHDIGVLSIDEPPDTASCADTVMVVATVCNYGQVDESFDVSATIDSSGIGIYADLAPVVALSPDSCQTVHFVDWPVPDLHDKNYNVTVVAYLSGDVNPGNDTLVRGVVGWCPPYHDVAVDYISEPWDTVWCGDTVAVAAGICNYGDSVGLFDVRALIDTSGVIVYADTQMVSGLMEDSCRLVTFADWPIPYTHLASYEVTIALLLPTDADPTNDTMSKYVTGWCPGWHDVLAAYISSPPDTVLCDSLIQVEAIVCNYSDSTETFDVEAIITDSSGNEVYIDTASVLSLVTDTCVSVTFQDWTVPALDSMLYDVSVMTLLAGDGDPTNDTVAKTVFGWCFTGVSERRDYRVSESGFRLGAPRPSPSRGETWMNYVLPCQSRLEFRIYDVRGRVVRTIVHEMVPAGAGAVQWGGEETGGTPVVSGIYLYEFRALPSEGVFQSFRSSGKLIVLR